MVIAMDGIAASGKSSLGKLLAEKLGFEFLDTGTLYRLITCRFYEYFTDIMHDDIEKVVKDENLLSEFIEKGLEGMDVNFKRVNGEDHLFAFGNKDYTSQLHDVVISKYIPFLSSLSQIRQIVRAVQHNLADSSNIIVAGRDTGTVVFPDALIKFFVTIDPKVRAERRLKQAGLPINVENLEIMEIDLEKRDYADEHREAGAMKIADDAVVVDNSTDGIEKTLKQMLNKCKVLGIYQKQNRNAF